MMLDICLIVFAILLFLFESLKISNRKSVGIIAKYTFIIIIFILSLTPFYRDTYSLPMLLFSFFDMPSIFTILLLLTFILKTFAKDFSFHPQILSFLDTSALNLKTAFLFLIYGLILYLGNLNLISFDIYHSDNLYKACFVLIFLCILCLLNKFYAFLAFVSLLIFVFSRQEEITTLYMDFYLFIFVFLYCIFIALKSLHILCRSKER